MITSDFLLWLIRIKEFSFHDIEQVTVFGCDEYDGQYEECDFDVAFLIGVETMLDGVSAYRFNVIVNWAVSIDGETIKGSKSLTLTSSFAVVESSYAEWMEYIRTSAITPVLLLKIRKTIEEHIENNSKK